MLQETGGSAVVSAGSFSGRVLHWQCVIYHWSLIIANTSEAAVDTTERCYAVLAALNLEVDGGVPTSARCRAAKPSHCHVSLPVHGPLCVPRPILLCNASVTGSAHNSAPPKQQIGKAAVFKVQRACEQMVRIACATLCVTHT